ncbi:MAG TPA: helicase-related protein [Methanocorpusculum sp.]|nr:helicase-related protein [Methanocorpusculum sp.]HJK80802.1 helicase-related protein [Methanocorpusculum sp.]
MTRANNPKIIDNKRSGTVFEELRDNLKTGSHLSIISAYFTIYAYAELKKELSKIDNLRFIFTEPTFVTNDNELMREYYIDHSPERKLQGNEFEIKLRNEMKQAVIARECADWIRRKVEIKSLRRSNPAQFRLIHLENPDGETISINGTVDFTTDGLGITPSTRNDSNTCMYGTQFTQMFLQQFNELWEDSEQVEDVKNRVLEQMLVMYKENTPQFIYFVSLYHVFSSYLGELTDTNIMKDKTGFEDTLIWNKLYKFQKDGAKGVIDKIEKYNGCILADSVGLGKTFTALAVIKYYELRNDRVLVLVPKRLRENWTIYTQNDSRNIFAADRFNYDVLNHTDLDRTRGKSGDINLATVNWANYDLLVIDESHNFRNAPPHKDRMSRYQKLMQNVVKSGVKTKVLMLSATPVNNRMADLKNQIAIITEENPKALVSGGVADVDMVLQRAQAVFSKWTNLPDEERTTEMFVRMMDIDYFKLLDTITIARSRKHIEKYYPQGEVGRFPRRLLPENHYPEIDLLGEFPSISEVSRQIHRMTLCLYLPTHYVLPAKKAEYAEKYDFEVGESHTVFKQSDRESSLTGLMRMVLLKRLESSVYSFTMTVEKMLADVSATISRVDSLSGEFYDADLNILDIDPDEEEYSGMVFGRKVKVLLQDMDLVRWRQDLVADREMLASILEGAKRVTPSRDAKLAELREVILQKISHPLNEGNRKVVVFTAFADTARYLYENLRDVFRDCGVYSGLVTGAGGNASNLPKTLRGFSSDMNAVLTLFSPRSKECEVVYPNVSERIDVLFATDCVSEGQNLQDCDFLVNYDIHWNPLRIVQRFGRVDRIGSRNEVVQLVNFWPMQDLDEYINLQRRVKGRMVLLDVSATGEENLIEPGDGEMRDLEYRRKQLHQLQSEVVDLEDISGGISITDLTFNDAKVELMDFMRDHRRELEEAPTGMYAVVRVPEDMRDVVKPGVIFVLRQIQGIRQSKEQNPLFPYYVMYVSEDGGVELSYLHAKRILDYYSRLCADADVIQGDVVEVFHAETRDGYEMRRYSDLLEKAIFHLIGTKQEVGVASLFSKGGTTLQRTFYDGVEDFELVSFLVMK